jgi:WD40 repeat protein/serine/threonine protein kinase
MPVDADAVSHDDQLQEAILTYLKAADTGQPISSQDLLTRYPKLTDELTAFLADQAHLDPVLSPLRALREPIVPPLAGDLGDYRILRAVGRGGMGVVYEAEQISLARRVALKVLPFAATMDPRHLQRFQNEARAAASLEHPHIVPVYGVGCERGVHYYAMKFIDGLTMAALIHQQRASSSGGTPRVFERRDSRDSTPVEDSERATLDTQQCSPEPTVPARRDAAAFRQIAEWGIQAAEALEHAHSFGVVHRDIKPANLMIDGQGKLWVTDFGLARTGAEVGMTMTGDVLGTLRYMSPEQAAAQHSILDHRTDVYSLGATLYELFTLQPVFTGTDRQEVLRKVLDKDPLPMRDINPSLPVELDTVVLKSMAKNPNERFATCRQLAQDLERWLEGKPVLARPVRPIDRLWRWCKRNKVLAGLSATVGLSILATLAVLVASVILLSVERAETLTQKSDADTQRGLALAKEKLLRQQLYPGDISVAFQSWKLHDLERMRTLLDRHIPGPGEEDPRGFEWYFLSERHRYCTTPLRVLNHGSQVYGLAISPDGKTLASVGQGPLIRLWELKTGEERVHWVAHDADVGVAVFSPDGNTLATGSDDSTIKLWDIRTLGLRETLGPHEGAVDRVFFSPDSHFLVSAGKDPFVKVWDLAKSEEWASLQIKGLISDIALAPDGSFLAVISHDGFLHFWDRPFARVHPKDLEDPVRSIKLKEPFRHLAFNHRGDKLVLGSDKGWAALRLVNSRSGDRVADLFLGCPLEIGFSPNDEYLASASDWEFVHVWNLSSQSCSAIFKGSGRIDPVCFLPDGKALATGTWDGRVYVWDLENSHTQDSQVHINQSRNEIIFSKNRSAFAAIDGDGAVRIQGRDKAPWTVAFHLPMGNWKSFACTQNLVNWAFVDRNDCLSIWNRWEDKERRPLPILGISSGAMAFSPDGRYLVAGNSKGGLFKYDLKNDFGSFSTLDVNSEYRIQQFWFSNDGDSLAFVRDNGDLSVLAFPALKSRLEMKGWHNRRVHPSPDGLLVLLRIGDHVNEIQNLMTGNVVSTIVSDQFLNDFAFSPDNRTLVSTSEVGTLQFWNVTTGQELFKLHVDRDVTLQHVVFSSDGQKLYAGGWAKDQFNSYIWQIHPEPKGDR